MFQYIKFASAISVLSMLAVACAYDEEGGTPQEKPACSVQCKPNQYCLNGSICTDLLHGGENCTDNAACLSGICYSGECTCSDSATCGERAYCTKDSNNINVCQKKLKQSEACTDDIQCLSGLCSEGLCKGCSVKADCDNNQICDVNVCRPIVACPNNSSKKCFLIPNESMFNSGTISITNDSTNFVGTTFKPVLTFDDNSFNVCGLFFASPVITSIMTDDEKVLAKASEQLINYLKTHEYVWALFYEYYINIMADSTLQHQPDLPRDQVVAGLISQFADVASAKTADKFWNASIDALMQILQAREYTITREEAANMVLLQTLQIVKQNLANDIRFTGRINPKCIETILERPTMLTFVNNGPWKKNNFYLLMDVSDSTLSEELQITNNKFLLSASADYASNVDLGTRYAEYLQFPLASKLSDLEKVSKQLVVRYETAKCRDDGLTKTLGLTETPTCEAGYHQFYIKSSYSDPSLFSCEAYYTMTGRCKDSDCSRTKYTNNMSSPETNQCLPAGYFTLNNLQIYVELTDEDLK